MGKAEYLDFELRIEKKGQRYLASVVRSPIGEASVNFKLPFSKLELENFILRMEGVRRETRRIRSPEMEQVRQFGSKLFAAVFSEDVRTCFISGQNEAKTRGAGLRLKLRLEAPELINIPWEYLYDDSTGRFLALFENTPIVRYIDVRERCQPLKIKPPLNVLVMVSSPEDYPPLNVKREKSILQDALQNLIADGTIRITWMEKATLPALADTLMRGEFNIFHFIGHGGFDERCQDGILILENGYGSGRETSCERLAILLGNQPLLRLVVLNACEGARTSANDPFAGVATTLVRTGCVPAVVAMQLVISDLAAITFARGFYSAVSVGHPVDAAITQARLAIFATGNDVEWGTPVLYMRSPDGVIFDIQELNAEERLALRQTGQVATSETEMPARLEEEKNEKAPEKLEQAAATEEAEKTSAILANLYDQAQSALAGKDWSRALSLLNQVQELDQGYQNTADLLVQAQAGLEQAAQVSNWLAEGKEFLHKGDFSQAAECFQNILALVPGHSEAAELVQEVNVKAGAARKQIHLTGLYNDVLARLSVQDWEGADSLLAQFIALEPGEREVNELLERFRHAKAQARLAALLKQGQESLRQGQFLNAENIFAQVLKEMPGHQEALEGLARIKRQARLNELFAQAQEHLNAGRLLEASASFQAVLDLDPTHLGANQQLAQVKFTLYKQEEDEKRRQAEITLQEELARQYDRANAAAKMGDWLKAIALFQGILDRKDNYLDTKNRLAQVKQAQKDLETANERKAVLAKSFSVAQGHFQARRWREAIQECENLLKMDPTYADPAQGSALALLKKAKEGKERSEMPSPPPARPTSPRPASLPDDKPARGKPTDLPK